LAFHYYSHVTASPILTQQGNTAQTLRLVTTLFFETQGLSSLSRADQIRQKLDISSGLFRVTMSKLLRLGFAQWHSGMTYVLATEKGVMYAYENGLIK